MGIVQHHDAVSGTEREAVNQDYSRILTKARDGLDHFIKDLFQKDIQSTVGIDNLDLEFCRWN